MSEITYTGAGVKLQYNKGTTDSPVWTDIANIKDINPLQASAETTDVTTHSTANNATEHIKTRIDYGEIQIELIFDPDSDDGQKYLKDQFDGTDIQTYQFVFPNNNSTTYKFDASVTAFGIITPLTDVITASITLKINGKPEFDA